MTEKSLGKKLVAAVKEALAHKESGKTVRPKVDVAAIRKKLGMTQKQFSTEYHIRLQTLRNWEQEKRVPDTTTLAYLICIAKKPKLIHSLLNRRS